jgi:hypothetical protein
MGTTPQEQFETRRIILLRGKNPEVLLGSDGRHRTLPQVQIPRCQRVAEHLTTAFRETCGVDAVSLCPLESPPAESRSDKICYEIMEPRGLHAEPPQDKNWVAVDCLVQSAFRDPGDFQAIRHSITQSTGYAQNTSRGPFGRLGWFPDLTQWVQEQIGTQGLRLNGKFRQLNACPTFSLIRFETDGPAVWFKAVGAPNQREYPVTLALTHSFSRFLPQILATRPECTGWLACEADGPLLRDCPVVVSWEAAAADLAELQISSLGRSLHLLDAGARDLRAGALADFVETFFQVMGEVMERQTKMPPAPLSREGLRCLSARGAEAFVGHPFLTFQFLLEHFRQTFGQDHSRETQLVSRYSSPWRAFVSESDIRRALEVAPLVAVFAYATGNDRWTDPRALQEPGTASYLRSLTRRMDREARGLVERSVLCLS